MSDTIYTSGMSPLRLATISASAKGENVGSKKTTPCQVVDDYVVLTTSIKCSDYSTLNGVIEEVNSLAKMGVNVVKIYGYISDESTRQDYRFGSYCNCKMVMDKAEGIELYKRDKESLEQNALGAVSFMHILANAPQEHYNKFVQDYVAILSRGVAIDPSKKENFFYDSEKGFTFIDVRNKDESGNGRFAVSNMLSVLSPPWVDCDYLSENPELEHQFNKLSAAILVKTDSALLNLGFTRENIDECFEDRTYSDGTYIGAMQFGNVCSVEEAKSIVANDNIM